LSDEAATMRSASLSNESIRKALWWICLLVAPAVLIAIELFHPAGFTQNPGMYEYLSEPQPYNPAFNALGYFGPRWWFTLHMIQTPMVALVALGLWLLVGKIDSSDGVGPIALAWLSRVATFVFLIYYTALDSIGGFGLARSIQITERMASGGQLNPDQLEGVKQVLNASWTDPWVGGVGSFVSQTGSWAVFVGALLAAVALFIAKKAPWPALLLLVAFGWELQVSHTAFHGPIAFALLIASAFWIWWASRNTRDLSVQ
jgi:hypothetical protein